MAIEGMSGFTGLLIGWVLNPLIWIIILFVFIFVTIGILYFRKRRKLIYPTVEFVDHGGGKFAINTLRSGYFGKKLYFKGLWWKGEEVLRTNTGEIIYDFSTEDFQEINGKRGVVCFRDPLNQDILAPINKSSFKNKELLAEIAPGSYREAAVDIFNETVRETSEWKDKMIQFGSWAMVIIFSLVAIIVITQMVKSGQEKAAALILQAGKDGAAACKDICAQAITVATSSAPVFFFLRRKKL